MTVREFFQARHCFIDSQQDAVLVVRRGDRSITRLPASRDVGWLEIPVVIGAGYWQENGRVARASLFRLKRVSVRLAGRPMAWPVALAGDKGYRADWIDDYLLELGIQPVIPSKANEDPGARPVEFDRERYRQRNIVERRIGWLKESRRVFSRFKKTARNFAGILKLAFIQRYLRLMAT